MTSNLLLWPWIRNSASVRFLNILSEIIIDLGLVPSNVSVIKVFQSFKSLIALRNILLIPLDQPSLCPCLASIQLDKLLHFHQRIEKLGPIEVFLQQIDQLVDHWLWFDEEHLNVKIVTIRHLRILFMVRLPRPKNAIRWISPLIRCKKQVTQGYLLHQ